MRCYRDNTHLIQGPCYQRGSPCQDPAGNWTTRRPPDDRKKAQTAVVWSCFPFIRSDQNHLARHSERGKKTRQTEEEVGRQHQGVDRPGVRQVPEGSRERGKWRKLVAKSSVVPQRPSRDDDDTAHLLVVCTLQTAQLLVVCTLQTAQLLVVCTLQTAHLLVVCTLQTAQLLVGTQWTAQLLIGTL